MIFSTTNSTSSTADNPFSSAGAVFYFRIAAPPPPRPPAPPIPCPHRLLGVACDATPDVLARAYKILAKATHPDIGPASEKAIRTQKMALINAAYDEARKQLS